MSSSSSSAPRGATLALLLTAAGCFAPVRYYRAEFRPVAPPAAPFGLGVAGLKLSAMGSAHDATGLSDELLPIQVENRSDASITIRWERSEWVSGGERLPLRWFTGPTKAWMPFTVLKPGERVEGGVAPAALVRYVQGRLQVDDFLCCTVGEQDWRLAIAVAEGEENRLYEFPLRAKVEEYLVLGEK
jgi:hypothetical protein